VTAVVGDGESETGPLAESWKSIDFLNPARDGAVLPILHLNGYKISGPTVRARHSDADLTKFFEGLGYAPVFAEGDDPMVVHQKFAAVLKTAVLGIAREIARAADTVLDARSLDVRGVDVAVDVSLNQPVHGEALSMASPCLRPSRSRSSEIVAGPCHRGRA